MSKALLVVDMQNDFLDHEKGTLNVGHDTTALVDRVAGFVKGFEGPIVTTLDTHAEASCEFAAFPPHCPKGEYGHAIPAALQTALDTKEDVEYIEKQSYTSDEVIDSLEELYKNDENVELHVAGVCTSICVAEIAAGYVNRIKNVYNRIPKVVIHKSLVDDFDPPAAEFMLNRLVALYGVTTSE